MTDDITFFQKLEAEIPETNAYYGISVSIADGLIAVGAPGVSEIVSLIINIIFIHQFISSIISMVRSENHTFTIKTNKTVGS